MKKISKIWNIPEDELRLMVEEANSMRELIEKVGLNATSGSNDITVKRCLNYYNIDWKSLVLRGVTHSGSKRNRELSDDELFTENCKHSRKTIKKRIIEKDLIPYKCSICGMDAVWQNRPLTLILDHINGIRNDNRLINLRFVCGNCNLQLETTNGNNNSERRKELRKELSEVPPSVHVNTCPLCGGIKKSKYSKVCSKCSMKKSTKKPSKDVLVNELLNASLVQIGKKYGVSDNSVRRWLKSYGLPVYYKDIKKLRETYSEVV